MAVGVDGPVAEITRAMSTAIAPVFLLTSAGTLLNTMATRYGRAIDRARQVLRETREYDRSDERMDVAEKELRALYRRARLLRTTIIFNVASIFCVSTTIFVIFANIMLEFALPYVVPVLFTLGLALLILSLALFIEDFAISLGGLKFEIKAVLKRDIFKGHAVNEELEP